MSARSLISPELAAGLAQAEQVLEHGVDNAGVPLSKIARSIAADSISWLRSASPDQSRKEAQRSGSVGATKELELEAAGVYEAYADGTRIRVSSRSIARRRIALAILSHPVDGPRWKVREPSARYQKKVRPRTPQEKQGLAVANQHRAEEAAHKREVRVEEIQKRRQAKAARV
jgi:hypothetical protein